jgi:hypothetical protein
VSRTDGETLDQEVMCGVVAVGWPAWLWLRWVGKWNVEVGGARVASKTIGSGSASRSRCMEKGRL